MGHLEVVLRVAGMGVTLGGWIVGRLGWARWLVIASQMTPPAIGRRIRSWSSNSWNKVRAAAATGTSALSQRRWRAASAGKYKENYLTPVVIKELGPLAFHAPRSTLHAPRASFVKQ